VKAQAARASPGQRGAAGAAALGSAMGLRE